MNPYQTMLIWVNVGLVHWLFDFKLARRNENKQSNQTNKQTNKKQTNKTKQQQLNYNVVVK